MKKKTVFTVRVAENNKVTLKGDVSIVPFDRLAEFFREVKAHCTQDQLVQVEMMFDEQVDFLPHLRFIVTDLAGTPLAPTNNWPTAKKPQTKEGLSHVA